MFDFLKKPKTIELTEAFDGYPLFTGIVNKGPIIRNTPNYIRYTYYVTMNNEFLSLLTNYGFYTNNTIRYEKDDGGYIIIEKEGSKTKIAYHKKK